MSRSAAARFPLVASVTLLCLPLAFQLAAGAGAVPEDMWLVLVCSIWASLTTAALLALGACAGVASLLRHGDARSRAMRFPRTGW